VNHLADEGGAQEAAMAMATRLEAGPAGAIMRAKSLLSGATTNSFDEQLEAEADNLAQSLGGAEAKEGITAFIERRVPTFPEE
jgi:enoyl-CoA hydratase/carnithine racemase